MNGYIGDSISNFSLDEKGNLEFEVFYKMLKEMSEHIEYYINPNNNHLY